MSFVVVVELLCFLVYAYEDRGEGCVSGLPGPFCPGIHLCGLLNLPTRPEEKGMERERMGKTEYRGSKKIHFTEPGRKIYQFRGNKKKELKSGKWQQIKKQMIQRQNRRSLS